MMNINIYNTELFPYLEGEEVKGNDMTLTMADIKNEEMLSHGGQRENKHVLYFRETKKGFVLNKTNAARIAQMYGGMTGAWEGKQITLTTERVRAFGEDHNAIRVVPGAIGPAVQHAPTKGELFARFKSELGIEPAMAAAMLKEAGFTNGYDPDAYGDMWLAVLNAPVPQTDGDPAPATTEMEDQTPLFDDPPADDAGDGYYESN